MKLVKICYNRSCFRFVLDKFFMGFSGFDECVREKERERRKRRTLGEGEGKEGGGGDRLTVPVWCGTEDFFSQ